MKVKKEEEPKKTSKTDLAIEPPKFSQFRPAGTLDTQIPIFVGFGDVHHDAMRG